jgi:lipopolysaccharide biosynthesis glycosyltransferase
LRFLRSLTPFPITVHQNFNFSWVSLWNAAHKNAKRLIWVVQVAARLFLPWILREKYIFYVDADTLWGRDFRFELHILLTTNPNYRIYICHDCSAYRPDRPFWFAPYLAERGLKIQCFGNAGVFILPNDPGDIARRLEKAVPLFNRYAGMWPDQDVLNYMYTCKEKYLMPPQWNNHVNCLNSLYKRQHGLQEAIIHHGHELPFPNVSIEWNQRFDEWKGRNSPF